MGVVLAYAGLALVAAAMLSLATPLKLFRIRTRRTGAAVAGAGALVFVAGLLLPPAPLRRSARPPTLIDRFLPEFQFSEFHQRQVRAARERVFQDIRSVSAGEIPLFRLLTGIRNPRRLFRSQPDNILNPPAARPILEVATSSGFFVLAENETEIVIGTYVVRPPGIPRPGRDEFAGLSRPGYAKAVMNFHVEAGPEGECFLTTETRVLATDPSTTRRFGAYWRLIYPGSALIRRMWLLAIARRAEEGIAATGTHRVSTPR